jgi:hypothetical protein
MWCNTLRETKRAHKRLNNPKLANMRAWNVKHSLLPSLLQNSILYQMSSNCACPNRHTVSWVANNAWVSTLFFWFVLLCSILWSSLPLNYESNHWLFCFQSVNQANSVNMHAVTCLTMFLETERHVSWRQIFQRAKDAVSKVYYCL